MEVLDLLERLPAIADAMQRSRVERLPRDPRHAPRQETPWKLIAHEAGHPMPGTVHLRSYAEARVMALELSELGFRVAVHDFDDHVRLRLWPPQA